MFKATLVVALLAFAVVHDVGAAKAYYVYPNQETFVGAWIGCKAAGMKLASVESEVENIAIQDAISKSRYSSNAGYWIGAATGTLNDNGWYWLSADLKMTFSYWGTGQPRYDDGIDENGYCIRVGNFYKVNEIYKWENIDCTSKLYYICEVEA
ncbi:lectin subunit alpha-like [Euwallacea fornicatus]|uniref:lectin subunit alpha-like n=1 Tax=Euwallacea fornicatus TaxID=995702 RepID=UPI00338D9F35